jgi:hypothetical protein
MKDTAQHLREIIEKALPVLRLIADADAAVKPRPDKWSDKEILGHLIDSACNNQQKIIRTANAVDGHLDFVGYEQDNWVAMQQYNAENWSLIVALWAAYNFHLAHVIEHLPADKLENTISINGVGAFKLGFIAADYVEHLKHHLRVILPDMGLSSSFSNVYNA